MAFADSTLLAVKLCSGAFGLGHLGPPIFRGHSGQGHSDWGHLGPPIFRGHSGQGHSDWGHLGPPIFRGHSGQGHSDWGIMLWNDLTERMDGKGNSE